MSRVRPTRQETEARLVQAALAVFERKGIAATSVEDIVTEAGYTRGAFYSSFESIDSLVLSVIDLHVDESIAQLGALMRQYPVPAEFIAEFARRGGGRAVAPHDRRRSRILDVELNLYALRNPSNRPRLAERLQKLRTAIAAVVERHAAAAGVAPPLPPEEFAAMLMAMDDGLAVHSLLEPEFYAPDTFFRWLAALQTTTEP